MATNRKTAWLVAAAVAAVALGAAAVGAVALGLAALRAAYLVFTLAGFAAVVFTRSTPMRNRAPTFAIAIVHGIAGLTIFLLPIVISMQGQASVAFALVGLGGALIGLGGLLISFLKTGRPLLSKETILKIMPGLLLLMTVCFVAGFKYG